MVGWCGHQAETLMISQFSTARQSLIGSIKWHVSFITCTCDYDSERNIPNSSAFLLFAVSLQRKTKLIFRVHVHWCFKFCANNLSHLGYRLTKRAFCWRLIEEIHQNQIWRPRITWCCVEPTSSPFCFCCFKMLVAGPRNRLVQN
jgi:hypothetical protein